MHTADTRLTSAQQREYLNAVRKGLSTAQACAVIGVPVEVVEATLQADIAFALAVEQVGPLLSQNAAAKLYREGMDGNVSALTFLLKNQPPPEWTRRDPARLDDLDALSDEELLQLLERSEAMVRALRDGEGAG